MTVLSSEAANRIRDRIAGAQERDLNALVLERSFWRLCWPVVLIVVTVLNIILAGDYMIRIADASGPEVFAGLTRGQLINWTIAAALIIATSVIMVILGDDKTRGPVAAAGRTIGWVVVCGLICFSVWTALSETATKLQSTADQGTVASARVNAAGEVVDAAMDAQRGAELSAAAARRDVMDAQTRANDVRLAWTAYQNDAQRRYTDPDHYAWAVNTTHSRGPGRTYIAAIQAADTALEAARGRLQAAEATLADARAQVVTAQRQRAAAVSEPSAEAAVIHNLADSVGLSSGQLVLAWGLVVAILLEVVRYAGSQGTARLLRSTMDEHEKVLGAAAKAVKEAAGKAAQEAREAQEGARNVPQSAQVYPGPPPIAPQPIQAQPSPIFPQDFSFQYQQPMPAAEPMRARYAPAPAQAFSELSFAPPEDFSVPPPAPAAGIPEPSGEAPDDAMKRAAAMSTYAESIANALADADTGRLKSAGFDNIKRVYKVGAPGAEAIREALIQHGKAMKLPNGRIELMAA